MILFPLFVALATGATPSQSAPAPLTQVTLIRAGRLIDHSRYYF